MDPTQRFTVDRDPLARPHKPMGQPIPKNTLERIDVEVFEDSMQRRHTRSRAPFDPQRRTHFPPVVTRPLRDRVEAPTTAQDCRYTHREDHRQIVPLPSSFPVIRN